MASTNTALFFGFLAFWTIFVTLTGLVSSSLLIASTDGDISSAISEVESEAGFFSQMFLWIASFVFDQLGFDGFGTVILGFAALPEWLNFVLFVPLTFMLAFSLIVSLIPTVG